MSQRTIIFLILGITLAASLLVTELGFRLYANNIGKYNGPPKMRTENSADLITPAINPRLVYELHSGLDVLFLGKTFQTNSFA